jgi:serine/threonine-protein kinase
MPVILLQVGEREAIASERIDADEGSTVHARAANDGDSATLTVEAPLSDLPEPSSEEREVQRLVGATLGGGYRLISVLGYGGMGAVYRARDPNGEDCAVKVILSRFRERVDDTSKARFRREATLASGIDHPNVVRILAADVDAHQGHPFYVMELLRGHDLAWWMRQRGALDPSVVARIFVQACHGLAAAHAAGVVHRDFKPANIVLSESGDRLVVKICDFGLAKNRLSQPGDPTRSLTHSDGGLLGTPQYTAPEQAQQAKHADNRADVWALCISMYEALSGERPFKHCETLAQLILAICTEKVPRLERRAPWLDPALVAIVHKGLMRDPDDRWQTMDEIAGLLVPFAGGNLDIDEAMLVSADTGGRDGSDAELSATTPDDADGRAESSVPSARTRELANPAPMPAFARTSETPTPSPRMAPLSSGASRPGWSRLILAGALAVAALVLFIAWPSQPLARSAAPAESARLPSAAPEKPTAVDPSDSGASDASRSHAARPMSSDPTVPRDTASAHVVAAAAPSVAAAPTQPTRPPAPPAPSAPAPASKTETTGGLGFQRTW